MLKMNRRKSEHDNSSLLVAVDDDDESVWKYILQIGTLPLLVRRTGENYIYCKCMGDPTRRKWFYQGEKNWVSFQT